MKIVIVSGGKFHSHALAEQLFKYNYLEKIFTVNFFNKNIINNKIYLNNFNKYLDYFFFKFKFNKFINKSKYYVFKDNIFDYWLNYKLNNLKLKNVDIFVCWAGYFLNSIENIKKTGAKIILESGSCHILEQNKLLQEEYDIWGLKYPAICQKNIDKMVQEYNKADYIMTISSFVYNSFLKQNIPEQKLLKVICGFDTEYFLNNNLKKQDKKFRVIFVGILSLRKGVQYLLKSWEKLKLPIESVELILVGNIQKDLKEILKNFTLLPNIIFYGSVSREKLVKLYKNSSLLVLSSIEDGFGMVLGEAMACGLPVICTTNTAGQDLIQDNKEGFIIPIRDIEILSSKIEFFYKNPDISFQMGLTGKNKVKNFTWDIYGQNVIRAYEKVLGCL